MFECVKSWVRKEIQEAKDEMKAELERQTKIILATIISAGTTKAVDIMGDLANKTKTQLDDEAVNWVRGVFKDLGFIK